MDKFLKLLFIIFVSLVFMASCATIPRNVLTLINESLKQRQIQTRKYGTTDEAKIFSACTGLLQDMEFNIDESEPELGVIVSSKMRSAVRAGQQVAAVVFALLEGGMPPSKRAKNTCLCYYQTFSGKW